MTNINIDQLRRLRRQRKLKIRDVAKLIGKDPSTVWRYENGLTKIKADTLFQLADLYGVTVNELRLPERGA
jgi:transcriptional regulator with XRE-family HTH domain